MAGQYRSLSKYRLLARLGSGGMAEVYLALSGIPGGFNKLQVLKVLRPDLNDQDRADFLQMFRDEARLAARLSHPNIVHSHEVGSEDGHEFIAMEYLDGQPLSRIEERGWTTEPGFPLEMQLFVFCQVLEGLEYAHTLADYDGTLLNIVHRDVSPQNVFITYSGHVKLVDFGIAKTLESCKTRAGVVKGKVPYMSPEQVLNGAIDRRADLFSVGVMLWEAIAQRHMHGDAPVYEILRRLVHGDLPKIREAVPEVPAELERIVECALTVNPEYRYASATAFRDDLQNFLDGFRRVSCKDISERVCKLFSKERREINEVIRVAMDEANRPDSAAKEISAIHLVPTLRVLVAQAAAPPARTSVTSPPLAKPVEVPSRTSSSPSLAPARLSAPPAEPHTTTGPPLNLPSVEPRARASDNRWLAPLAAVALLALAVGALVTSRRPESSAVSAASTVALDHGERALVRPVAVRLHAIPAAATMMLDGKVLASNPFRAEYPRDAISHTLEVSAPGFVRRAIELRLDHDIDLEVQLAESGEIASSPKSDVVSATPRHTRAASIDARARTARPSARNETKIDSSSDPFVEFAPPKARKANGPALDKTDPWSAQ